MGKYILTTQQDTSQGNWVISEILYHFLMIRKSWFC